ncbi:ABC transporter ATP-binding protein [Sinanaerobacter sp. ZZT-01]|uniref:ABC transporter ATP-binding protein n=1 Tax=Sinanaerobacter sp. ZZT-01 TaxID=3111540 RepID=UPI002D79FF97|nr:ABC transporter ATP-binding protein [Sinanaerobacter sp. ZZT-01]WRR93027.1 ABC transporter ATP-binding protein [Sinanaerobacter sp. ZZT-01]
MDKEAVLRLKNLEVSLNEQKIVQGLDLSVHSGRITALVGESGCGKTTASLAVMGLLSKKAKINWDIFELDGEPLKTVDKKKWNRIRGNQISMIFQDSLDSLDPVFKLENQIIEGILAHKNISKKEAYRIGMEQLQLLQFDNPEAIMKSYPSELSGGMCQRVMIAIAVLMQPKLLIADEPTTALDVTLQAEILKQIYHLSRNSDMGVLFITHDLGVVAEIADDVYIMKNGKIIEAGTTKKIFERPENAYTKMLLKAMV